MKCDPGKTLVLYSNVKNTEQIVNHFPDRSRGDTDNQPGTRYCDKNTEIDLAQSFPYWYLAMAATTKTSALAYFPSNLLSSIISSPIREASGGDHRDSRTC